MEKSLNQPFRDCPAIRRSLVLTAWLLVSTWAGVAAEEPNPDSDTAYVLLANGNVLRGEVAELGDTVYVTREDQSVIRLSRDHVRHIGGSMHELYEQRIESRIESDLRKFKSDIRWCLNNGLVREAAQDVLAARRLAPADSETYQLLRLVSARLQANQTTTQESEAVSPVQPVSFQAPIEQTELTAVEIKSRTGNEDARPEGMSEATFIEFSTRVQPILMNRCVRCHAKDENNKRDFQIHTALTSKWNPDNVAEENLRQVLRFVNQDAVLTSPLRARASDGHGGRKFTLGKEGSVMMNRLDQWLRRFATETSALPFYEKPVTQSFSGYGNGFPAATPPHQVSTPRWPAADAEQVIATPNDTRLNGGSAGDDAADDRRQMRRMPKVDNPFDPEIFNRRYHRR